MAETKQDFTEGEPSENLGFVRFNWRLPAQARCPLILMAPRGSDAAFDFVESLSVLGYAIEVWRLDPRSNRAPRNRHAEMRRMERAWRSTSDGRWIGVLPFDREIAKLAVKTFPESFIILAADDLAVIGVGDESHSSNIRRSMMSAATSIAEMAVFATSTTRPLMMVSMRKAKEFPGAMLHAVCEFRGQVREASEINTAAKRLGRPQVIVAVAPIRKLLAVDVVRGGIEPVHKNGSITGWAKRALSADRVDIGARLNGEEIARTQADRPRQDLVMSGVGDGHYGFILDVSKRLSHHPVRIEIYAIESGYVFGAVDMNTEKGERVPTEAAPPPSVPQAAAE